MNPLLTELIEEIGRWSVDVVHTGNLAPTTKMTRIFKQLEKVMERDKDRETQAAAEEDALEMNKGLRGLGTPVPEPSFERRLKELINEFSMENSSSTPDYILADFLMFSLASFNRAVRKRSKWYSTDGPGQPTQVHAASAIPSHELRGLKEDIAREAYTGEPLKTPQYPDGPNGPAVAPREPRGFKHPEDWTQEDQKLVAETIERNNPLYARLRRMDEEKDVNSCICGGDSYPNGVHLEECPARDKLRQPTPNERQEQMDNVFERLSRLEGVHFPREKA